MFTISILLGALAGLQLFFIFFHSFLALPELITKAHIVGFNKILSSVGLILIAFMALEIFDAWNVGYLYEEWAFYQRLIGNGALLLYLWLYIGILIAPQLFWLKVIRQSLRRTVIICLFLVSSILLSDYFLTTLISLNNDFIPSSWN